MDTVLNNKTIIHDFFFCFIKIPMEVVSSVCCTIASTRNGTFDIAHKVHRTKCVCVCVHIQLVNNMEKPCNGVENLEFTSVVDRDRSVPVALRVPGKSRQRNTPMTACRTQRRSAPSVRNATLISTAQLMAEIKSRFRANFYSTFASEMSSFFFFFLVCFLKRSKLPLACPLLTH